MVEVSGIHAVIRNAGIVHADVLMYLRYYTPHHPQYVYRDARYVADETLLPHVEADFNQLVIVADEYGEGVYDVHQYEGDATLSVSCCGVKKSLPVVWQGYLFLAVRSLELGSRKRIHGILRSEPHLQNLARAFCAL